MWMLIQMVPAIIITNVSVYKFKEVVIVFESDICIAFAFIFMYWVIVSVVYLFICFCLCYHGYVVILQIWDHAWMSVIIITSVSIHQFGLMDLVFGLMDFVFRLMHLMDLVFMQICLSFCLCYVIISNMWGFPLWVLLIHVVPAIITTSLSIYKYKFVEYNTARWGDFLNTLAFFVWYHFIFTILFLILFVLHSAFICVMFILEL